MRFCSFRFKAAACVAILCAACLSGAGRVPAQAPPGPLPPSHPLPPPPPPPPAKKKPVVEARTSLAGYWRLNTDESDNAQQKLEDARKTTAGPGSGGGGPISGPRVGIGYPYPGGPNGPYGEPNRGDDTYDSERMWELIRPEPAQTISLADAEVDSMNDHGNKLVFYTDGRKIQKSKDDSRQEIAAHWSGQQLVSDEKGPKGKKISRTYELSSDGKQIYETWHLESGRSGAAPIVIRYVYDASREYDR